MPYMTLVMIIAWFAVGPLAAWWLCTSPPPRISTGNLTWVFFAYVSVAAALLFLHRRSLLAPTSALVNRFESLDDDELRTPGETNEERRIIRSFNRFAHRQRDVIAALELDKNRLKAVLEGMAEGVIALDGRQNLLFANGMAGQMFGFASNGSAGRPIYELTRHPRLLSLIERASLSPEPLRDEIESTLGQQRFYSVFVSQPRGQASNGTIIVMNDTTEFRKLDRLRRDFVANVSHELKTPLTVIQSSAEALLDGAIDDHEVRIPFLRQITDQSARLHALILDLISLARIESGEEAFEISPTSLVDAIRDSVARHRPTANQRSIQFMLEGERSVDLELQVDPEALEQILDNLIGNAVKYSSPGKMITIGWEAKNAQMARFSVRDEGPGIPAADLPLVFQRFYRVDKARSRALGGTGLGLSIVKHLVQEMKGKVMAESELGVGTTMTVCLPIASSNEET
jgi:two-component system, OmpR family, phosphate regulon sensor histidine kinase PhoR